MASALKESAGSLRPADHDTGRAFLVRYDTPADVARVVRAVRETHAGGTVKVVTRHNSTIRLLTGRSGKDPASLGCRPATALHRGVRNLAKFDVLPPEGFNLESALRHKHLVLTAAAAKALEGALS